MVFDMIKKILKEKKLKKKIKSNRELAQLREEIRSNIDKINRLQ